VADKDDTFMEELCEHHVSGQLKVAPEHISDSVLKLMGKPENAVYEKFQAKYKRINDKLGKNQFIVPYLISSHPGSTLKEAIALAEYLRDLGYMPEQVQDFYPTPSTISTCMYYTGLDPRTMEEVYTPKSPHEKAMQRALIQYRNPKNYDLVVEALRKADRMDLIGFDKKCLVRPRQFSKEKQWVEKDKRERSSAKASNGRENQGSSKDKPSTMAKSDYSKDKSRSMAKSDYSKDKPRSMAKSDYSKDKPRSMAKPDYSKDKSRSMAKPDYSKDKTTAPANTYGSSKGKRGSVQIKENKPSKQAYQKAAPEKYKTTGSKPTNNQQNKRSQASQRPASKGSNNSGKSRSKGR
jgi:hypothetical protein